MKYPPLFPPYCVLARVFPLVLPLLLFAGLPALAGDGGESIAGESDQARADETIGKLRSALAEDPAVKPETRAALLDALEAIRAESARSAPAPAAGDADAAGVAKATAPMEAASTDAAPAGGAPTPPPVAAEERPIWERVFDRLAVYGDAQFRYNIDFYNKQDDNHRARVRLRLGANYQVFDSVLVGARILTGPPSSPRTPHVDLGNGLKKLDLSLDRAFISWRPTEPVGLDGLVLTAGKFQHPFGKNPVFPELVWDYDTQPEGIAAEYSLRDLGPVESAKLIAGEYLLVSKTGIDKVLSTVLQAQAQVRLADDWLSTGIVGYTYYSDPTPDGNSTIFGQANSNAVENRHGTVDGGGNPVPDAFVSDFGILNPILALTYEGLDVPITVSGEYILNTRAEGSEDTGWAAGISIGSSRRAGDWRVYYQWQEVDQDAVLSVYAQDTFYLGSGYMGHVFGVNYQFLDKVGIHPWVSVHRPNRKGAKSVGSGVDQWRLFVDFNIRF